MKVLMFSVDYDPDPGGIAGHVYQLARALNRQGAHVTVVGGHVLASASSQPIGCFERAGLREVRIRRAGPRGFRAVSFFWQAKQVLHSLRHEEWDVLHFHNPFPDGLILRNLRVAKIRICTNHSDSFLRAYASGRNRRWYNWLATGTSGIIGPSEEIAEKSRNFFRGNGAEIEYIPNGVDTAHFCPGPRTVTAATELGSQKGDDIILLAVRRHDPKCGLEYLVRAMPVILANEPRALLCLVGDGSEGPALRALANELKCADRIHFVGRVENNRLPSLYRAAYLSVLPSIFEAVSLSGLESLACGCPVVGTKVGGIPAFVLDRQTGVLVEPKSPSSLADGICRLLYAPPLREQMARAGRALAEQHFSWGSVAIRTLGFYQRCLEKLNPRAMNSASTPKADSFSNTEMAGSSELLITERRQA